MKLLDVEKVKKIQEIFESINLFRILFLSYITKFYFVDAELNIEILNYAFRESLIRKEKSKKADRCCSLSQDLPNKKTFYWNRMININTIIKIAFLIVIVLLALIWHQNSKGIWLFSYSSKGKY